MAPALALDTTPDSGAEVRWQVSTPATPRNAAQGIKGGSKSKMRSTASFATARPSKGPLFRSDNSGTCGHKSIASATTDSAAATMKIWRR